MTKKSTYKNAYLSTYKRPKNTAIFHSASSGKEKDSETGYYYFGARYYNSDLSLWLSVDPMADKYPNLSPYNYCAWNPLKIVDPDGMELWQPEITSKGAVSYVAELGDSKESFAKQYNLSKEAVDNIFEKNGVSKVSKGTRISGSSISSSIKNNTGRKYSDVLKLSWKNSTKEQKAYHTMFAILCNRIRQGGVTDMNEFINGLPAATGEDANISISKPTTIPLINGGRMTLESFYSSFSQEHSQLVPQPPNQFQTSSGTTSCNHSFVQYPFKGYGIPRLMVAFPETSYNSYIESYYR